MKRAVVAGWVLALLSFAVGPSVSAALNDGLVLYFPCDEPFNGTQVQDHSGVIPPNNGTAFGAVQVPAGLIGGACRFEGTGPAYFPEPPTVGGTVRYIKVNASASLNVGLPTGSGQFTLAAWYNVTTTPDESNDQSPLVEWDRSLSGAEGLHMWAYFSGSGTGANIVDVNGGYHVMTAANQPRGEWHHVAVTYDRTTGVGQVYIDGQSAGNTNFGGFDAQTATDLYIGRRPWDYQRINGLLDDIRVYNRVLSASEIQQLFELVPVPFITKVEFSNAPDGPGNITSFPTGSTLYIRLQNIILDTVADNFTVTADVGGLPVTLTDPEGDGSYAASLALPFSPGVIKVKVKASSPTLKKFLNYDSDIRITAP